MTTIGSLLDWSATNYPDKPAIIYDAKQQNWTYREFNLKVNQFANALSRLGVKKGDVVSAFLYNSSEFVVALFASAKIGAIYNPINYRLTAFELQYILNDAQSKVLLYETKLEEVINEAIDHGVKVESFIHIDEKKQSGSLYFYDLLSENDIKRPEIKLTEDDHYILMYTSGTTGKPKGVLHRHRNMVHHSFLMNLCMGINSEDIGLTVAPLNHTAELHTSFVPRVQVGATNIILREFEPYEVLETLEKEKVTHMFAAPTMINMLLNIEDFDTYNLSSLRLVGYGGASMAPILIKKFIEKTNTELVQMLGTTEMGPVLTVLYSHEQLARPGSAGKAILTHEVKVVQTNEDGSPSHPDNECKVGEVGEIIVRGPSMMLEYYKLPEATDKALAHGWYHTGDMGSIDEDGYIWVHDRRDYRINSGSENIYPREVEDVLLENDEVVDVAVIGKPDEEWGEIVVAFVVPKSEKLTEADLDKFIIDSKKVARFKRPREYYFIDDLPKTASGKVQKFILADRLKEIIGGNTL